MTAMKHRLCAGMLVTVITGFIFAADFPERDEYAWGFPLTVQGDAEFFAAELPLSVYRSVSDPTLRDAGVYNSDGHPVPRWLERPLPENPKIEQAVVLGLVPLYGRQADQHDQLRVLLRKDAGGIALDMNAGKGDRPAASIDGEGQVPSSYIVDLRNLEQPLEALEFAWVPLPQGFIGTVRIETSRDLQHWRSLGTPTLAELQYEDTLIEQKRVSLPDETADYLRISPQDMPESWRLEAVSGRYSEPGGIAGRESLVFGGLQSDEGESEYVFELGGFPPTDRVNLSLPGENVVVRASIFYRQDGDESWRLATSGIYYNLSRQGHIFRPEDVPVPVTRASVWKVRIDTGMTTGPVRLRLGWRPDRLLFVAQGTPPFELVTGRYKDRLEDFPQDKILGDSAIFKMLRQSGQAGSAVIGPREQLAGAQVMKARVALSVRTLILWAGLIGAVVLVGWLVYSLMKDLKREGSE